MPTDTTSGIEVYRRLRSWITAGKYEPGERLVELTLADELQVSRTPVREAMRQLERDGLITVEANRGARVVQISGAEVGELYDLRAVVEGYCAAEAAHCAHQEQLRQIDEIAARLEAVHDHGGAEALAAVVTLNSEFHKSVVRLSGNKRIIDLYGNLTSVPIEWRRNYWRSPGRRKAANLQHRELITAIEAGDALWADAVARAHVYSTKAFYSRLLQRASLDHSADGGVKSEAARYAALQEQAAPVAEPAVHG